MNRSRLSNGGNTRAAADAGACSAASRSGIPSGVTATFSCSPGWRCRPCWRAWAWCKMAVRMSHLHSIPAAELLAGEFAGYAALFVILMGIFRLQYNRPLWTSVGWTRADPARSG